MDYNKGDAAKGEIELLEECIVYENDFAVIYDDYVKFPSGSGRYLRKVWKAPYGVMIFARDISGNILLINNFRHENRAWTWEIPKGFGEHNLSPQDCAKKELKEETGLTGHDWKLFKVLEHPSYKTYIYSATIKQTDACPEPENSEAISEVSFFSPTKMRSMIHNNDVSDPSTLFCLSYSLIAEP